MKDPSLFQKGASPPFMSLRRACQGGAAAAAAVAKTLIFGQLSFIRLNNSAVAPDESVISPAALLLVSFLHFVETRLPECII